MKVLDFISFLNLIEWHDNKFHMPLSYYFFWIEVWAKKRFSEIRTSFPRLDSIDSKGRIKERMAILAVCSDFWLHYTTLHTTLHYKKSEHVQILHYLLPRKGGPNRVESRRGYTNFFGPFSYLNEIYIVIFGITRKRRIELYFFIFLNPFPDWHFLSVSSQTPRPPPLDSWTPC